MNPDTPNNQSKAPYRKPRLRVIKLVAREVLGIGCKTENPAYFPPALGLELGCGWQVPCSALGT